MQTLPNSQTGVIARGLGVFSIVLGMVELLATRLLNRKFGMKGDALLRAYGAREIASGIGILASKNPAPFVWSRVAGDALDLATMAPHLNCRNPKRGNLLIAIGAVLGVTALDLYTGFVLNRGRKTAQPKRDYSKRTGFADAPEVLRGAAFGFVIPEDFRTPEPLRPYPEGQPMIGI